MVSTRGKRPPPAGYGPPDDVDDHPPSTPEPDATASPATIGSRLRRKRQSEAASPTFDKSSPEQKRRPIRSEGGNTVDDAGSPRPRRGRPPKKAKQDAKSTGPDSASRSARQRPARRSAARVVIDSSDEEPVPARKRRKTQRQSAPIRADSPSRSSDIHDEIIVATKPMSENFRRRRQRTETSMSSQAAPDAEQDSSQAVAATKPESIAEGGVEAEMQVDVEQKSQPDALAIHESHPDRTLDSEPQPQPQPQSGPEPRDENKVLVEPVLEDPAQPAANEPAIKANSQDTSLVASTQESISKQATTVEHELQPEASDAAAVSETVPATAAATPLAAPLAAAETNSLRPGSAVTILKIIDYCAELEGLKKRGRDLGQSVETGGMPTSGAPHALKMETLPILEELAEQLLHAFATLKFKEISSYVVERSSVGGKAYARLKQLFDDTKKVYATKDHFLLLQEIEDLGSNATHIARKANMATFVTSCFGSGDVGFYHLDRYFLDTVTSEGQRLLKQQWSLYLDLKTQSFISAMHNTQKPGDELLQEVFGGDLEQRLLQRRPGAKALGQSELDFIRQLRIRKEELRQALHSNYPRDGQCQIMQDTYKWDDFLHDMCAYLSKYFDSIVGKQPAELRPLHESGLSLSPKAGEGPASDTMEVDVPIEPIESTDDIRPPQPPYMTPGYPDAISTPVGTRASGRTRRAPRPIETSLEKPKRGTRPRRQRSEHTTPIRPAEPAAPSSAPLTNGFTESSSQPYSTAPSDRVVKSTQELPPSPRDVPTNGPPLGYPHEYRANGPAATDPRYPGSLGQSAHAGPNLPYAPVQAPYVSPFAPTPSTSGPNQAGYGGAPSPAPGAPFQTSGAPPGQFHPYWSTFERPHSQQSKPTNELYEAARRVANSKSSGAIRSRPQNISQRRPWTTEEESALMAGIDTVKGPQWSSILAMYGPGGTINEALKSRTQVQLKDKARNLKLFFLKNGIEVPYYLSLVTGDLKQRTGQAPDTPPEMTPGPSEGTNGDGYSYRHSGEAPSMPPEVKPEAYGYRHSPSLPPPPLPTMYPTHGPLRSEADGAARPPFYASRETPGEPRRDSEPYYRPSPSLPPPPHPHYQSHSSLPPPPPSHPSYTLPPPPSYGGLPPPPSRSEPSTPTHGSFPQGAHAGPPSALPPISTHFQRPPDGSPAPHTAPPPQFAGKGSPYPTARPYPPPSPYETAPHSGGYPPPPPRDHDGRHHSHRPASPGARPPPPQLPPPPSQSPRHPAYRSPHQSRPTSAHHQPPSGPGPMLPPLHGSPRHSQGQRDDYLSPRQQQQPNYPSPRQHHGYPSPLQPHQGYPSPRQVSQGYPSPHRNGQDHPLTKGYPSPRAHQQQTSYPSPRLSLPPPPGPHGYSMPPHGGHQDSYPSHPPPPPSQPGQSPSYHHGPPPPAQNGPSSYRHGPPPPPPPTQQGHSPSYRPSAYPPAPQPGQSPSYRHAPPPPPLQHGNQGPLYQSGPPPPATHQRPPDTHSHGPNPAGSQHGPPPSYQYGQPPPAYHHGQPSPYQQGPPPPPRQDSPTMPASSAPHPPASESSPGFGLLVKTQEYKFRHWNEGAPVRKRSSATSPTLQASTGGNGADEDLASGNRPQPAGSPTSADGKGNGAGKDIDGDKSESRRASESKAVENSSQTHESQAQAPAPPHDGANGSPVAATTEQPATVSGWSGWTAVNRR